MQLINIDVLLIQLIDQREFAVWLGLTPKQHASGNVSKMGGITKLGDRYLRKQLVHGARVLVSRAAKGNDPLSVWAMKLRVSKPLIKWRLPSHTA